MFKKRKKKVLPILLIILIILILLIGGVYLYTKSNDKNENSSSITDTSDQKVEESSSEIDSSEDDLTLTSSSEIENSEDSEEEDAINAFMNLNYFNNDYIQRYKDYKTVNEEMPYEQVILNVNIGLDHPFYTNTYEAKNFDSITVLVNKYSYLPSTYAPTDLVTISAEHSAGTQRLRKEAAEAFEKMCSDASELGFTIKAASTYRPYDNQLNIYNRYVARDGVEEADTYSARAGHSEHQTGLVADVQGSSYDYNRFGETPENEYVLNNAYKYGFIVRYTNEKVSITGYKAEPWHLRYVGTDIATIIQEKHITYDEYCAIYGN